MQAFDIFLQFFILIDVLSQHEISQKKKIIEKQRNVNVEDVFLSRRHLSGFKVLSFLKHSHNKKEN